VYGSSLEKVHTDLVEVGDRADNVAGDVALVVEFFETAPDVDVLAFGGKSLCGLGVGIAVYPLLYID
jgi:hypothetical protein